MLKLKMLALMSLTMALSTPIYAQGTEAEHEACQADAYKWCPYDVPDVAAVAGCLRKNMKSISPACQAQFPENQKRKH